MVVQPYWHADTWVFDDEHFGLVQEPFVSGAPEIIDTLVSHSEIPRAQDGFTLIFSEQPFPGHQATIVRTTEELGGNWYRLDGSTMEGWLCPALGHYFHEAPEKIYVHAKALST